MLEKGSQAALHITIISNMQQLTLRGAAENQGHALLVVEERTLTTRSTVYKAVGISFIPLAIEAFDGLSDTTSDTLSSISRLLGKRLGISTLDQHITCSNGLLYLSGEVIQQSGSTAVHLLHHLLMV